MDAIVAGRGPLATTQLWVCSLASCQSRGLPLNALVITLAALQQNDAAIDGQRIQNDGQACARIMRVGAADAGPDRLVGFGAADGIGDEDGIVGHAISVNELPPGSKSDAASIPRRIAKGEKLGVVSPLARNPAACGLIEASSKVRDWAASETALV